MTQGRKSKTVLAIGSALAWSSDDGHGFEDVVRALAYLGTFVLVVAGIVALDPIQQFDEFKQAPTAADVESGDVGFLRGGGSGRYQFWETALDAFAAAPVEGVGASGYTPYWFEHREVPIPATRAHSVVFETLAELGLLGFAALAAFFAVPAVTGIRRLRAAASVSETAPALALLAVGLAERLPIPPEVDPED